MTGGVLNRDGSFCLSSGKMKNVMLILSGKYSLDSCPFDRLTALSKVERLRRNDGIFYEKEG
jgi:hypothetical protein